MKRDEGDVSNPVKGVENQKKVRVRRSQKGELHRNTPRDLSRAFTQRLTADFKKHGIATIERVRKDNPTEYLKIVTRILPKDVNLTIEHTFTDVLMEAQRKILDRERGIIDIEGEVIRDDQQ